MPRQRAMFAATLAMLAIGAVLVWRGERDAFVQGGVLEIDPDAIPGVVVLSWSSDVRPPLARSLEEAFRAWSDETDAFVIRLNSPGGSIVEGRLAIDAIKRIDRTHRIETEVGPRGRCLSMCVPIFLQGEARRAGEASQFMFHEPTAYDIFTDERVRQPMAEREREAARFVERFFVRSPMDPVWRDELVRQWRGKDVWKSGGDLVAEGSGVVTELY